MTNPVSAVEPIKLTGLVDSVFGNLNGDGDCDVPQDLAPSATYTCTFTGPVAGNGGETHTNEVTGTAQDNDENTVTGKDTADVKISDVVCSPVTQTDGDADSVGWGAGAGAGSRAGGCFTTAGNTSIRRREPNLPDSDPRPSPG